MKTRLFTLFLIVVCGMSLLSQTEQDNYVQFQGRQIDLQPYVEGFPYYGFNAFFDAGKLFYYHRGETTTLHAVELGSDVDLASGTMVTDIDFSKRNTWGIRYHKDDKNLYWTGDEVNDEIINLYRLDMASRELSKLTDVPYIFGWRWDKAGENVAYVARLGDKSERLGELRLLNLHSGEESVVLQDTPEFRFTWGSPSWQPEKKGVIVNVVKNADRTYGNLAYVDLASGKLTIICDADRPRSFPSAYETWLSSEKALFLSNEDGFSNLYKYNITDQTVTQLTHFKRDIGGYELIQVDGRKVLFVVLSNPIENEIVLIDPINGQELSRQSVDTNLFIRDSRGNELLVSTTSAVNKFRLDKITVEGNTIAFAAQVGLPAGLQEKILHSRVERIEFPTFDVDPATGEKRMLHAFLYHPKNPPSKDKQIVMIQSFYGGGNFFNTRTQILAEAGIYVLSPSPRGSSGFGREFSSLNDKDLGGNEIIDIIYAGKYISKHLGIPAERIGVYGGSHGGYATMRLLTFPGEINETEANFDWGFGISHAGFSDIVHFYEHCNIPDWVTLEAGDPATESAKLRDRSPLYHADNMSGRLLLTHGTNDSRVPIEGSRQMADSLNVYGKDVTLVEFEGQGHGIKGLANTIRNYKVWFTFLEESAK